MKKHLPDEGDKNADLYKKKYRHGVNVLDVIDTTFISAEMGMSALGFGLLATVVAAPVVL